MTKKVIFIANDGTEFEREDECCNYEKTQDLLPKFEKVQMWDSNEDPIPTPTSWKEIENALNEMHFVRGSGVKELWDTIYNADLEYQMLDYSSFWDEVYNINDTDLLMFDGDADCWVNVNCLFDKYRKILKNFS